MKTESVYLRFYAELNDFLPPQRRQTDFIETIKPPVSVKHLIESVGVTHTEVDLILVNGESVDFHYLVRDSDRISVYPVFEGMNISSITHLRPEPLRNPRFVLDTHLGRLAAYLRILGFDSLYRNDYTDDALEDISVEEGRTVLTRDRGLLKRKRIVRGYFVRSIYPREQTVEVVLRFDLKKIIRPFSRCPRCNGALEAVRLADVVDHLRPDTRKYYRDFTRCNTCGQIYWNGSHVQRMRKWIETFLLDDPSDPSTSVNTE
jgi:uncharacterized protein